MLRGVLFSILLSVLSFHSQSKAVVYGEDDRVIMPQKFADQMGFKPVVYLFAQKDQLYGCNGVWIGDRYILTAKHCVAAAKRFLVLSQYENFSAVKKSAVVAVYVSGSSSDDPKQWYKYDRYGNPSPNGDDWAVLETDLPDGQQFGYMPILNSDILEQNPQVRIAGYHGDDNAMIRLEYCSYRKPTLRDQYWTLFREKSGLFNFDCDLVDGLSGAPVTKCKDNRCGVVGVVSGEFPPPESKLVDGALPEYDLVYGNVAVQSKMFIAQVKSILSGHPQGVKRVPFKKVSCPMMKCLNDDRKND